MVPTPTRIEKSLVARALMSGGILIGSVDEIWTHPSAFRALSTWRLCMEAITTLIGGGHGVQASFVKACVMQLDDVVDVPFALDEIAEFMIDDPVARMYWNTHVSDPHYSHRCPFCGAAAFIGIVHVDCKARCPQSKPWP